MNLRLSIIGLSVVAINIYLKYVDANHKIRNLAISIYMLASMFMIKKLDENEDI